MDNRYQNICQSVPGGVCVCFFVSGTGNSKVISSNSQSVSLRSNQSGVPEPVLGDNCGL